MKARKIIAAALVVLALEGAVLTACVVRLVYDGLDITAWERVEEQQQEEASDVPDGVPEDTPEE